MSQSFEGTSHVPVCVHYLWSSRKDTIGKNLVLCFLNLSSDTYIQWWDHLKPSLLQSEQLLFSQLFPAGERLQSLHHLCGHWLISLQWLLISFVMGNPELAVHNICNKYMKCTCSSTLHTNDRKNYSNFNITSCTWL